MKEKVKEGTRSNLYALVCCYDRLWNRSKTLAFKVGMEYNNSVCKVRTTAHYDMRV